MTPAPDLRVDAVLLADGSPAAVRHLLPADRDAVEALFGATCAANLYTRFFSGGRHVVDLHVDHVFGAASRTVGYVAERDGGLLGVADVEPVDEHTAEIAFLVADTAHGLGVATLLLERAAADAWDHGVTFFVADVLARNHPMIDVFVHAGFTLDVVHDHDEVTVRMSTETTPEVRAAAAARRLAALARGRATAL